MSIVAVPAPEFSSRGVAPRAEQDPPVAVIGIPCCRREIVTATGNHPAHAVVKKYVDAVVDGAGGIPLLVPAEGDARWAEALVARLDGLLMPGSPSNVEPHHYAGDPSLPETLHDPARDAIVLPLLRAAAEADLPVLAICRGIQELNVALGGTLHQNLHLLPGRLDHRAPALASVDERYAHRAHGIALTPGGYFERLAGTRDLTVNSLHSQGIDRLAASLQVEAVAPDGQIEAVALPAARFIVGVQWHPEFRFAEDAFSARLFAAFGAACRNHAAARRGARSAADLA
ncbi:MAG TPA: gamma-glutamyl-gamma-aminobutyrate hydrolase family protein [Stellaceae bacterium]|nr:gamma-glutamyl-gamma-aminobutyrate hydrolase family protein [Stellaceae bacterium]